MPKFDTEGKAFPGSFGKDYRFVVYGGVTYVVYVMTLSNGKSLEVSWSIDKADLDTYGIKPDKIQHLGQAAFQKLNNLGSWSQVAASSLPEEHPFTTFIKELKRQHGDVSWLHDEKFVSILLEGWAEGWSESEIQNVLQQTHWYQSRTDRQRAWEMDLNKADRRTQTKTWTQQVSDSLKELYGADFNLRSAGITQQNINKWAMDIASGKWGDPNEGFQFWLQRQQTKAEGVEGTPAWIGEQQKLEEQRAFANRPEDMFQQLKEESRYWLGPVALPSDDTLRKWATDLVSETKSDADWKHFLEKRAQVLYPFLDAGTSWQEFADPYKATLEKTWGTPINWDNPLLQQLGQTDATGKSTGNAMSFYDFEVLARQDPKFWGGSTARQEGFDLYNYLNQVFSGVTS